MNDKLEQLQETFRRVCELIDVKIVYSIIYARFQTLGTVKVNNS